MRGLVVEQLPSQRADLGAQNLKLLFDCLGSDRIAKFERGKVLVAKFAVFACGDCKQIA